MYTQQEVAAGEPNARGLANIAWAFAKTGQLDEAMFAALAKAARPRLGEFISHDLANTAWAFAPAGEELIKIISLDHLELPIGPPKCARNQRNN